MTALAEIQSSFWSSITELQADEATASLKPHLDLNRLAIYRNTVITAHVNALETSYPRTRSILEDHLFKGLAKGYFFHHLPSEPNLNDFGSCFPQWLKAAATEVDVVKQIHLLIHLEKFAQMEWAWEQGYHAEDRQFSENDLQRLQQPADQVAFQFHPAVQFFCFELPVSQLFAVDPSEVNQNKLFQLPLKREYLLIFREQWQMKVEIMDAIAFQHAKWIRMNLDYQTLQNQVDYQESILAKWMQQGIIANTLQL